MPGEDQKSAALSSVLDRLLDDEPGEARDRPRPSAQTLRDLRDSVLRDVSNLLNTRRAIRAVPQGLDELRPSVLDYGIPDFTASDLSTAKERDDFRRTLEETIRRYDPRMKSVRIHLLANADPADRTLRFRVDALLHADPAPEAIVFDSVVDAARSGFSVGGRTK